jgi:hypothetical protein
MSERESLIEARRWRASFAVPGGQSVYFYWFDALDRKDAERIATEYAERSLLAEWTMNLWCPDA